MKLRSLTPLVVAGILLTAITCGCDQYDQFDPGRETAKRFDRDSKETQSYVGRPIDDITAKFGQPISAIPAPDDNRETMYIFEATENLSGTPDDAYLVRRVFWIDASLRATKASISSRELDTGPTPVGEIPH